MKITYTTSDGQTFDTKAAAKAHEAEFKASAKKSAAASGLVEFLATFIPELTPELIESIAHAISTDPVSFRQAVAPLMRGTRKPRADAGVPRGRYARKRPAVAAA